MEDEQIDPVAFIEAVTSADNLVELLADDVIADVAQQSMRDYEIAEASMQDWRKANKAALDLAQLVKEDRTYPFTGASNVKYPLVLTAALQFQARAYPALVPSSDLVKCKINGADEGGEKAARGMRVSAYMTHQLLDEMEDWEPDTDRLLMLLPIVGDMYRKVWRESNGEYRTRLVEPGKLVVHAGAQSINRAPSCTEELTYYPHEIEAHVRRGTFAEFEHDDQDAQEPHEFLEHHGRFDLDEDGYPEPYVVTIHKPTQTVVRMVADFEPDDVEFTAEVRPQQSVIYTQAGPVPVMQEQEVATGITEIRRGQYFIHYRMLPSVDGKLQGMGFGLLLGDISETVNTSMNMMIDAGHFEALGGGFIGSEMRMAGGSKRFRPGEYKMIPAKGGDIRSAIVDRTFPGPSNVMFQMLGLLIDAGREISSTKDVITGENAGQMTATTAMAMIEQGMKVFTAAYKRIFRSMGREFRLIAKMNARYLDPRKYQMFLDEQADPRQDFSLAGMDILPVADPNAVTKQQEMARAQLLLQMAEMGIVDPKQAAMRVLEAASIDDIEELLPQPDPAQQQMMALQIQQQQMAIVGAQADLRQKMADIELTIAKIESERAQATKYLAAADAEQRRISMDAIVAGLREQREDLRIAIDAAASGRVAPAPGNGGAGGSVQGGNRGMGGRAMPGVSPGGTSLGGGAGGLPMGAMGAGRPVQLVR